MTRLKAFREAIRAALGYAPDVIEPGKLHRFATRDRRGDDAGWCKLFDDMRGGVFGCNRSGESHNWSAIDRRSLTTAERTALARSIEQATRERERQRREAWAVNAKRIASLWAQCVPVTAGDPVHRYLCRRLAIDSFEGPQCLRLHPALDYWHEGDHIGTFPAMVAPLTAPNGRVVALHRTYLTADGRKADVPGKQKKLTERPGRWPARRSGWQRRCMAFSASPRAWRRRWPRRWPRECQRWPRTALALWLAISGPLACSG